MKTFAIYKISDYPCFFSLFSRLGSDRFYLLKLLCAIGLYTFSSRTLLNYFAPDDSVSIFFIASGVGLATVLIGGNRYALSIFFGSTLSNTLGGLPVLTAMGMGMGSTLGAVLGANWITRNKAFDLSLPSLTDWLRLVVLGGCFGCSINAVIGSTSLLLSGLIGVESYPDKIVHWWMGDTLGVIVTTPFILTWWKARHVEINPKQVVEALIIIGLTFLVGQAVFFDWFHDYVGEIANTYWMFLLIAWLAVRLDTHWMTLVMLITAIQSLQGVYSEFGIFDSDFAENKALNYWFYIIVLSAVGTTLSTYIATHNLAQIKQQEALERLQKIAGRLPGMVYQFRLNADGSSCFPYASPAIQDIYHVSPEEVQTSNAKVSAILHPDDYERISASIKGSARNLTPWQLEYRVQFEDGTMRWLYGNSIPQCESDGSILWHGFITDITERKRAETELYIAATVFESQEGMLIADANCVILKVNQAFSAITGYSASEAIGQTPRILYSGRHDAAFYAALWQSIYKTGAWKGEIWNRRKNGEIYPEWQTITAVRGNNDGIITHYVATLTDITERKATEEYINRLAFYDPLTQLPNRRLLQERLKHGIEVNHRTGNQMAVLMMDLDKFKAVNDTLGHAAGDELLQHVTTRIKARLRKVDMVARLGGDEFVILMEDVSHYGHVARIAESIIHTLSQPFILSRSHDVRIGASIGISIHPQHGNSVEALLDNADTALYHAKDQGRGCFAYFSEQLTQKAREHIELEERLRCAIKQRELRVYFQPQIDVSSGRIAGAEALVRWHDPINGWLMPKDFIPFAEESGLIVTIGEWVLRETCSLGRQWLDEGLPPVTLAVNVSPYQFRRCNINALVTEILNETGFPAQYLELEITETGLMENQEHAVPILNSLHKQGVRFAIDDFGSGYSSLACLKYFPLDVLKIDKTFINDIPVSQGDRAIASAIIAMAHHLGFKVLAEGVETGEQLAFLQEQSCDMYQGYFYSKAVSATAFAQLLSTCAKVI